VWVATALQGRWGDKDEEVSAGADVLQYYALEVAAGDPRKSKKTS